MPDNREALWMPFAAKPQFKRQPRRFVEAEGMHYLTADGRRMLDGIFGLWCVNGDHRRRSIIKVVRQKIEKSECVSIADPASALIVKCTGKWR